MKKTRFAPTLVRCLLFLCLFSMVPAMASGSECGLESPAFPVDSVLWPDNFSPVRPGERIPDRRDSTDYVTQTVPGWGSGHELYRGVDILDNYLYVAYNAGIQVWNIDPNDPKGNMAELPEMVAFRDGWLGHFLSFPDPFGEDDSFIEEVDVVRYGPTQVLMAVSGRVPEVGFSLWIFNENTEVFNRVYQDNDNHSFQVRIVEHSNGKFYAFSSREDGVNVYDVDVAMALSPCLEDATDPGTECPGVLKGKVGSMTKGRFIDVLQTSGASPRLFLSASDGGNNTAVELEIYEITDPSNPSTATLKFGGLSTLSFGSAMWQQSGNYYLATVQRVGLTNTLEFYNINACINGASCSLGSPLAEIPLLGFTSPQYLSFSRSGEEPFLYYGGAFNNITQTEGIEMLLDLSALAPTGSNQQNNLVEISGDRTITESAACGSSTVDYWGSYYPGTEGGYRNVSPRRGKFNGAYFYRAANGILDIHKRSGPIVQTPEISTTVQGSDPLYMNDDIRFTATAANCEPSVWTWGFDPPTEIASITDVSCSNGSDTCQSDIKFDYCDAGDPPCPDRSVRVTATNASCDDPSNNGALVTVVEPRAHVESLLVSIGGGAPGPLPETVNVCTEIRLSAIVGGRPGFDYDWTLYQVGDAEDTVIATASGVGASTLSWETELGGSTIFSDGFESGDILQWGTTLVEPENFRIELEVTNVPDPDAPGMTHTSPMAMDTFQVTGLDPLGFEVETPITTPVGAFGGAFEANTLNATEWRWIIEDPTDPNTNCNRSTGAGTGYANCRVIEWANNTRQITHEWGSGTPSGSYRVTVEARNCENPTAMSREATVTITGVILEVTSFAIDVGASIPNCDNLCQFQQTCNCRPSSDITFVVEANGDPDGYQFDWEGNGSWTGTISATAGSYIHEYTSLGQRMPAVRAIKAGFDPSGGTNLRVPADTDAEQTINVQP